MLPPTYAVPATYALGQYTPLHTGGVGARVGANVTADAVPCTEMSNE